MASGQSRTARPIVLVGMMGAGKTSVGRKLADRLRLPFADSDEEVERAAGRSIAQIFEQEGDTAFRAIERRTMARLAESGAGVIAAGGGAFADPGTRSLVLERCIALWLQAEPETLASRIGDCTRRPLLRGRDPLEALRALAAEREPQYAQAPLHVRSDDRAVEAIVEALEKFG